ncbi:MAG: hypothetical protein WCL51_15655 [Bacteroidota bacterium]
MRDVDAIYMEMFRRLRLFGVTNTLTFTQFLSIVGCFADYDTLLTVYEAQCDELELKTIGTTEDKGAMRETLELSIVGIARPLAGYFFEAKNMEVYEQLKCTHAMLTSMRAPVLISFATNLLTICAANPLALPANNITPAKITALTAANLAFKTIGPEPQTNIKNKTGKIKVKNATRKKLVSLIRIRMTNAMYGLTGINDAILADFLNIIKLVHTGIRHTKTGEATVVKSFQLLSSTTNAAISDGMINVPELDMTIKCRKDGSSANAVFPIKTFTISAMAFGYEVYTGQVVITDVDYEIITIMMVPVS